MQKVIIYLTLSILFVLLSACGSGEEHEDNFQESAENHANIVFAEEFIMFLSEGNFKKATEYYNESMKETLPAKDLENIWTSLEEQYGKFIRQKYEKTETKDDWEIIFINGEFEKGEVVFQIRIDQNEKITGFDHL